MIALIPWMPLRLVSGSPMCTCPIFQRRLDSSSHLGYLWCQTCRGYAARLPVRGGR